jgi:DNA-binding NtrC family response regulator
MADLSQLLVHPEAQTHVLSVRAKALIFSDPLSQLLLEDIERLAPADVAVLITGETGTGKELIARHLHRESRRRGEFVAVNCGALSPTLAEAELFGHQAGSFTGATETRAGYFEAANGGTLFLDEVGDLPLSLQVKLLRVLQEREVVRVGSRKPLPIDVRLLAATNIDLEQAVAAGRFRRDLFYRLNVVQIKVPPLASRTGDILPLVDHFLKQYSQRLQSAVPVLTPEARRALLKYAWPGNIRELENVVHSAVLMARDGVIRAEDLRFAATLGTPAVSTGDKAPLDVIAGQLERLFDAPPPDLFERLQEMVLRQAVARTQGNQVRAARLLGISRNILRTLLKRFGILKVA